MVKVYAVYVNGKSVKTFPTPSRAEEWVLEKGICDYKLMEVDVPDVEDIKAYKKERGEINANDKD